MQTLNHSLCVHSGTALCTNASAHPCRTDRVYVADRVHTPQSDIEVQAEVFRDCFKPTAYLLDKNFSWMTESQRKELGRKADEALKQAYIDQFSEMYDSDEK